MKTTPNPIVSISRRAAARLRQGHVWVYRSDVAGADSAAPGSLVSVADERRNLVGTALYSGSSEIALRMISTRAVGADEFAPLIRERIAKAVEFRRAVVRDSNAFRVVFSEADFLPGLIVDRYNDILSLQILTQAMDGESARAAVMGALQEIDVTRSWPAARQDGSENRSHTEHVPVSIVERVDAHIRELEQLPERQDTLLVGSKSETVVTMNGVQFKYNALAGQKTGAFLDQRENYAAAARYAHGRGLDAFCYQGGFALHLARRCESVTAVDSSRPALEVAEANERLNQSSHAAPEIEWVEANAFNFLKDQSAAGEQYDTIVIDPPAFAKSRRALATALGGYKELNLRALKMLRPGGVLVTCSCSYHVREDDFVEMLRSAAADARRAPRILEKRGQAQDHPVLLSVPETAYLKCVILQV